MSLQPTPRGTRFCHFFGGRLDLVDALAPYFAAGLAAGERCLWVTAEPLAAVEARERLAAALAAAADALRSGQLEVIDWSGGGDAGDLLREWEARHQAAVAAGFRGLRVGSTAHQLMDVLRRPRPADDFLAVASHELRTPLSSLKLYLDGMLQRMERGALDAGEARRRLGKALGQCQRMEELVANLLDHGAAATGRPPLLLESGDLAEIVREAAEAFADAFARRGVRFTVDARGPVPGSWDRARVAQVVTNLVSNALRHAAGAPVEVVVLPAGASALIVVRDGGPGIPDGAADWIFDRFTQAAPSAGGLGLGLWIVREIVDAHGGTIAVASAPGAGTAFTIELPRGGAAS